jgi:hypothetical protein
MVNQHERRKYQQYHSDLEAGAASTTSIGWKKTSTPPSSPMNAMIWSSMRRGKVTGPIQGFGKLLASL